MLSLYAAAAALAIVLPLKFEKKLVSVPEKVPLLPNALMTQLRPRYVAQAVLALVLGAVKMRPSTGDSSGVTTFWKTLPSATAMAPDSPRSKAWPETAYHSLLT